MITDQRAERAVEFIRDQAAKFARAKAQRIHLEEFRKSKKALLMQRAETDGHATSAAQEREAYADSEYLELLEGLRAAVEAEETLKWRMLAAELTIDIWRTQAATNRLIDRSTA